MINIQINRSDSGISIMQVLNDNATDDDIQNEINKWEACNAANLNPDQQWICVSWSKI